jgi:hypothetical protein
MSITLKEEEINIVMHIDTCKRKWISPKNQIRIGKKDGSPL